MNDKFDELAKAMAQPVARRAALKKFGVGAAVALLAAFGLTPRAEAGNLPIGAACKHTGQCQKGLICAPNPLRPPNSPKYCRYPYPR